MTSTLPTNPPIVIPGEASARRLCAVATAGRRGRGREQHAEARRNGNSFGFVGSSRDHAAARDPETTIAARGRLRAAPTVGVNGITAKNAKTRRRDGRIDPPRTRRGSAAEQFTFVAFAVSASLCVGRFCDLCVLLLLGSVPTGRLPLGRAYQSADSNTRSSQVPGVTERPRMPRSRECGRPP